MGLLGTIFLQMTIQRVLFFILLVTPTGLYARVAHYDPAITRCKGKLTLQYFPGSPNFESIKDGDRKEGAYILTLDEPLSVVPTKTPNELLGSGKENNVKVIQLVPIKQSTKTLRSLLGKHLVVEGKLFHSDNGHHHARILMELNTVLED
jgi:hypothetical protein